MEDSSLYIMSAMYILAGIMHFVKPKAYLRIMPRYLPYHLPLVYLSGVFEIIFGALLLFPSTQVIGAWGIIAVLVGVFPANIHMLKTNKVKKQWYIIALWVRLPLQGFLIYWAWLYT
ncbi:MauE/DoxX family redox-associated membrane protein [uncultured Roseivirga sp.]|uniref:DoxX family protein n=1 Tax=uncultured Roseivirga sp. TaxID=543088 RepID=UPI0030D6F8A8|tara:strand:+ start:307309 stop:307659 length:351 start_codon:yes stop_codon:yes gene_type:complete